MILDILTLIPSSGSKQQPPLIPSLYSQISVLQLFCSLVIFPLNSQRNLTKLNLSSMRLHAIKPFVLPIPFQFIQPAQL